MNHRWFEAWGIRFTQIWSSQSFVVFFPMQMGGAISNIFLWELPREFYLKFQLAWHSDAGSMMSFWIDRPYSELTSIPANDDLFP